MSELKTKLNDADVTAFIESVEHEKRKQDSRELLEMFTRVTGESPKMWGTSIIGFGQYHYKSERSSQEDDWPLVAFSPRKQNLSLYLTVAGYDGYEELLGKLGKHKTGKGCLYINKLEDVDRAVLEELIEKTYLEAKRVLA